MQALKVAICCRYAASPSSKPSERAKRGSATLRVGHILDGGLSERFQQPRQRRSVVGFARELTAQQHDGGGKGNPQHRGLNPVRASAHASELLELALRE